MKSARRIYQPERHVQGNWLRDVILGGQDGLVNVLGIVLGVSAANGGNQIIIAASLAAAFAESVSLAAVAYTSALAEKDHYAKELERETYEVETVSDIERAKLKDIYARRGFSGQILDDIVAHITSDKDLWVKTMMVDELGLQPVDTNSILKRSSIVGTAALLASFVPIFPFIIFSGSTASILALVISAAILFFVGVYEARSYVGVWWKKGAQMAAIGLGAALVGYLIGKLFSV